jgi:DMSO/TMAO reductase YedYZ molybdopterin-dependent catalytic subunit
MHDQRLSNDPLTDASYSIQSESPSDLGRRRFLRGSSLVALSAAVGAYVPFARFFPDGLIPVALAQQAVDVAGLGKHPELVVLGDKPLVLETPAHLLDDDVTPVERLFVRNNGVPPDPATIDANTWTLTIDGESAEKETKFTLPEIKSRFRNVTQHLWLECAGNGRASFQPPAKGNPWTYGGVGFSVWTGVLLRDVLKATGVKKDAVYFGYYGSDAHLSATPASRSFRAARRSPRPCKARSYWRGASTTARFRFCTDIRYA